MSIKKEERVNLLLIEDDIDFKTSLANRLAKNDCNVTAVGSAEEALELVGSGNYEVIVSDIKLEGMDGLEFLSRIKKINEDLPVILVTGYANLDTARQAVALNAYNYLLKPLENISDILIPIKNAVQSYKLQIENKTLKEHYENIVTSVPDGILTINSSTLKIESVNKTFLKIFNTSEKEVLNKKIDKIFDKEVTDKIKYLMESLGLDGNALSFEWLTLNQNEKIFWANITLKRAVIGKKESILMVVSDITNLKRAEEDKKELEVQFIQMQKQETIGSLTGGIAHEFNNILSIILGHAQLSLSENASPELKKSLTEIEKATMRGSSLVENMTTFASPNQPALIPQDIRDSIDSVLQMQDRQLRFQNIEIEKNYSNELVALFDSGQMEQAILNLLINSMHAIKPKGKGKISITVRDLENSIEIIFQDTGIGMSQETQEKIFDPFFTTKGAYSKDEHDISGTGLGLSVTNAIINQHHGSISVGSEVNIGTTFRIGIPAAKTALEEKIITAELSQNINMEKIRNLRILLVEDEDEIVKLLKLVFKKAGLKNFLIEQNSKKAVKAFIDFNPDIVFIDLIMPEMNGKQVFEEIKKINEKVPLVLMSGKINIKKEELSQMGSYDYIKKPFNINDLYKILDRVSL
ncbi:MAG: response regulator [Spirochaetes bacterium]|nr:response regulator [Spirochaetota bacterium]